MHLEHGIYATAAQVSNDLEVWYCLIMSRKKSGNDNTSRDGSKESAFSSIYVYKCVSRLLGSKEGRQEGRKARRQGG